MDLGKLRAREARKAENDRYLEMLRGELRKAKLDVKEYEMYLIEEYGDVTPILDCSRQHYYNLDAMKWKELKNKVDVIKEKMKPLENYIDEDDLNEMASALSRM